MEKNKPLKPTPKNSTSQALIIVSVILGVALLALTFFGGVAVGRKSADNLLEHQELIRRQLTENLDRPIRERPLLKQIPDKLREKFNENGLIGKIIEIEDDVLLVETDSGARTVIVSEETKILEGKKKEERSLEDLELSDAVHILGEEKSTEDEEDVFTAKVIILTNGEFPGKSGPGLFKP